MVNGLEQQIVTGLSGLLFASLTAGIAWLSTKAKNYVSLKLKGQSAQNANHVIATLSQISNAVVQKFNNEVVSQAKQQGFFNDALASKVKGDACDAVKAQAGSLIALASESFGDVDALISTLIEKHVAENKPMVATALSSPAITVNNNH